jgi:hypothetical protein
MTRFQRFAFWFAAEFALYGLVVANGRAYNQGHYMWTLVTDMMISAFNFTIGVRFIENADNRDRWSMAGCVLGGGTGSMASILLTKWLYGQ